MRRLIPFIIISWFTCIVLSLVATCAYADNPIARLSQGDFNGFLDDALRTDWFNGMATAGTSAAIASALSGLVGTAAAGAAGSGSRPNSSSNATGATAATSSTRKDTTSTDSDTGTSRSGTRILDGKEAIAWMKDKDNGYMDKDGKPTKKFHEFMMSLPSEKCSGLQGFAGDIDEKGNLTGDFVIIVDDVTKKPAEQPIEEPEEEHIEEEFEEERIEEEPEEEPLPPPSKPWEPPCVEQKEAIQVTETEYLKLNARRYALATIRNQLTHQYNMIAPAAVLNTMVDVGSTIFTIATASTGTFANSIVQNALAEICKTKIDAFCDKHPDRLGTKILISEIAPTGGKFIETLGALINALLRDGAFLGGGKISMTDYESMLKRTSFTKKASGVIQVIPSAYSAGHNITKAVLDRDTLSKRINEYNEHIKKIEKALSIALKHNRTAWKTYNDCMGF